MLTETDDEELEAESRADMAYEAGIWRDLPRRKAGRCERRPFAERAEAVLMPAQEQK